MNRSLKFEFRCAEQLDEESYCVVCRKHVVELINERPKMREKRKANGTDDQRVMVGMLVMD